MQTRGDKWLESERGGEHTERVDAVDLVKIDGEWKVANFMWTVEKENCPTGPKP